MTIKSTGLNVKELQVNIGNLKFFASSFPVSNIGLEITNAKPEEHHDSTPQEQRDKRLVKEIMESLQSADEVRHDRKEDSIHIYPRLLTLDLKSANSFYKDFTDYRLWMSLA